METVETGYLMYALLMTGILLNTYLLVRIKNKTFDNKDIEEKMKEDLNELKDCVVTEESTKQTTEEQAGSEGTLSVSNDEGGDQANDATEGASGDCASKDGNTREAQPEEAIKPCSNPRIRTSTTVDSGKWKWYGLSVQGEGHMRNSLPCQDFHKIQMLDADRGIGVAVVSDGAGSKQNSDIGSQLVCEKTVQHMREAIERLNWGVDRYPSPDEWDGIIRVTVQLLQNDLFEYESMSRCSFDSLGATWMVMLFSPQKTYFAHIGDGRAGVLCRNGWKAVLTPHKGKEANQTVFITNKVLEEGLRVSGVPVPETVVIDEQVDAFVLMSDGCENGLWKKSRKENLPDGDFRYVPQNEPFTPALDDILDKMRKCGGEDCLLMLFEIIDRYNKPLKNETDDKTLCLGYAMNY